jgi:hypothetical protein
MKVMTPRIFIIGYEKSKSMTIFGSNDPEFIRS